MLCVFIFKGLRQIQPQLSSVCVHLQFADYITYRCSEDCIVDEFTGRGIHGKGKLLLINTELGIDLSGVAPRIYPNPFAVAGKIDTIETMQYQLIINRGIKSQ